MDHVIMESEGFIIKMLATLFKEENDSLYVLDNRIQQMFHVYNNLSEDIRVTFSKLLAKNIIEHDTQQYQGMFYSRKKIIHSIFWYFGEILDVDIDYPDDQIRLICQIKSKSKQQTYLKELLEFATDYEKGKIANLNDYTITLIPRYSSKHVIEEKKILIPFNYAYYFNRTERYFLTKHECTGLLSIDILMQTNIYYNKAFRAYVLELRERFYDNEDTCVDDILKDKRDGKILSVFIKVDIWQKDLQ